MPKPHPIPPVCRIRAAWISRAAKARIWIFLVFCALCLGLGEQYPFSNFPMYSNMEDHTYLLYITDENGQPIPLMTAYGMRTSILKKFFHTEARKIAKKSGKSMSTMDPQAFEPAGQAAIGRILSYRNDLNPELHPWKEIHLVHLDIRLGAGGLNRTHTRIATRVL